jgi:LPS export ABC transporter protein LptC
VKTPAFLALGAAVVLAAAFLLGRDGRTPGASPDAATAQGSYGYVALDADVQQTGDDGRPLYTFTAARVEQDPDSGDLAARALTVHYISEPTRPWTLTAREALMPGDSPRIRLQGDVQLRGQPPGSGEMAQVNSQRLDFDTRTQDVTTSQAVSFVWAGQHLNARGMKANLKLGQLQLDSRVHGRFAP